MPQMDFTVFFSIVETLFYSFFLVYLVFQLLYAQTLFYTVKRFISYLKKNWGVWLAAIQQVDSSGFDVYQSLGVGLRVAGVCTLIGACFIGWRRFIATAPKKVVVKDKVVLREFFEKPVVEPEAEPEAEPVERWNLDIQDINFAHKENWQFLASRAHAQAEIVRGYGVEGKQEEAFFLQEKTQLGYFVGELMTQSVGGNPHATKSLGAIVDSIPGLGLPFFRYQNEILLAKTDLSVTAIQQGCMLTDLISEIGRVL
jgi:hypothetical protein